MRKWLETYKGSIFLIPSFAGVSIFVLIPFIDVIRRSFLGAVSGEFVGLKNYTTVFQNPAFGLAVKNTLRFVGVCMPLLLVISLLLSVFLHKLNKYGNLLKMSFLVPMAIPVASVVLLWRVLTDSNGLLNRLLETIGAAPVEWMGTKSAFWVLVFSYLWKNIGYDLVLWMAGLSSIPSSIYEAAKVDGAGEIQIFFRITLPNLKKVFATISIISLLNSFKVFREAYLVAGDYPHDSMYLLQHIFNNWYRDLSIDKLCAAAVVVALVIALIVLVLQRNIGE